MNEPIWVEPDESIVIHDLLLARYGGSPGLRDEAALGAALALPKERFAAGCDSLPQLATAYTLAIIKLQPFLTGNLAAAFLIAITFLRVNGRVFTGKEIHAASDTSSLAIGQAPAAVYTRWLDANSYP